MNTLKWLFSPPIFSDFRKSQQARLLNVILWVLIIVPVPYVIYIWFFEPNEFGKALTQGLAGETIDIFLIILLKLGHVRTASVIQVIAFWVFFSVVAITRSGVNGPAYMLGYGLVISIAGILLGGRGAIVMTTLSLLSGAIMAYFEQIGDYRPLPMSNGVSIWFFSLLLFPVGATLQYLASRELRKALERARTSEERYRLISQASSNYTFSTEVDAEGNGRLVWVDGDFEEMTGYTFEEYTSSGSWLARVHQDDLEKDEQDMLALRANQQVVSEIRTYTKSGEINWERIYAHPIWDDAQNRLVRIVGAVQDVTKEKLAEEKLKETLLQQSAILNSIPDMAWLKDKNSRYIAVNEQFAKAAGMKIEEIVGKTDFDVWQERFANKYRQDDLEVMQSGHRKHFEELQSNNTGREYWVETFKTPILNAHGEVVGTTGIAREITERKNAELEREKLITELEAKNAELERFTYTVSHDLKSPLVTISGFIGYLEKDFLAGNKERVQQNKKRILQAAEKMQSLLNGLLELSRIGRLMNSPQNVPLKEIVNEAVELVTGSIEAKNVKLQIQDELPIICGDKMRLIEVIQNLIENAIKFMGNQAYPMIEIGTRGTLDDMPVIFVRDNGIGIPAKFHENIFGLFNKLNTNTEGSGIGLTLARRIIEVHGGKIWIESAGPEQGTTFCFTLPLSSTTTIG